MTPSHFRRQAVRDAAVLYRRAAAPIALSTLRRALRDGLPGAFEKPIRYLFTGTLTADERAIGRRIETLRTELRKKPSYLIGFSQESQPSKPYSGEWIDNVTSVPRDWGMCLFLLAKSSRARTILELGACAGISGCYLASADTSERFVTVEGSPQLAGLAASNLEQIAVSAKVVNATFDAAMDLLPKLAPIDLVYIDGDHTKAGRHRYFSRVQPFLTRGAIVVFDDLHYSEEMWQTWRELRQVPGVSWAVNFGRLGACVWDPARTAPARDLDLSPFTAWVRVGNRWKGLSELMGEWVNG